MLKLTIPNDLSYIPIARLCVSEAARKFGFPQESLFKIELALEEAASNVVQHAFEVSEDNTFDIICERIPSGMRIIIKEKGIPFDPARIPHYHPAPDIEGMSTKGLGVFLIKEIMDEVSFHNLGPEGKETHLIKYLPGKKIQEICPPSELLPDPAPHAGAPVNREKIDYLVRLMNPEEAIEISKGAYRSHGYTFFDDVIYYPERIIELNKTGELISAVAVTGENVFMGHAALHYPHPGARIAELTFAFVNPEYRSQGCMNRMCEFLFAGQGMSRPCGVYAYAVTNHIYTQKAMSRYGLSDCCIELATSPATWMFKGIEGDNSQMISVAQSFKYMEDPAPVTIYPPVHHRQMVERLCGNIHGRQRCEVPETDAPHFSENSALIETILYAAEGSAEIFVKRFGPDVIKEVRAILRDLCVKQIASITLLLNLEDPPTFFMTAEFEKMGFFFSGILPLGSIGDALVLQYLNNVAFDYGKVVLFTDTAKEILDYILGCDPNA